MKKLLVLICTLITFQYAMADKIVTKTKESIDCKVVKVGTATIEYKKTNNTDGPIYEIEKSNVVTIVYDNGQVDIFNDNQQSVINPTDNTVNTSYNENTQKKGSPAECAELLRSVYCYGGSLAKENPEQPSYPIYLSKSKTMEILECYDSKLANRYHHFSRMRGAGITLTIIGLAATGGGIALACSYDDSSDDYYYYDDDSSDEDWKLGVGIGIASLGTCMWGTGIPLAIVGGCGRRKQIRKFNEMYLQNQTGFEDIKQNPMTLSLNSKKNGIGLILTF